MPITYSLFLLKHQKQKPQKEHSIMASMSGCGKNDPSPFHLVDTLNCDTPMTFEGGERDEGTYCFGKDTHELRELVCEHGQHGSEGAEARCEEDEEGQLFLWVHRHLVEGWREREGDRRGLGGWRGWGDGQREKGSGGQRGRQRDRQRGKRRG